jgi:hypothetical protein
MAHSAQSLYIQSELLDVREFSKKKRRRQYAAESRHFVSFGAGVQSTALFLLIRDQPDLIREVMGALPEAFIFADTGGEPKEVYDHLNAIGALAQESMPLIVCQKEGPTLEETILKKKGSRFVPIPAFTRNSTGKVGMIRRQCTSEYKIAPLERAQRLLIGAKYGEILPVGRIHTWIGISTDEAGRAKTSDDESIVKRYPLLELGISRDDCKRIIIDAGMTPVKSRCYFCPYIGDWESFKADHPEAYEKAVILDRVIRDSTQAGVSQPAYLRRDCIPLDGILTDLEKGPLEILWEADAWEDQGFEEECEGICGL